jgi:peptidyl-prolyl cis-trans isomerase B (cyclophilin B)
MGPTNGLAIASLVLSLTGFLAPLGVTGLLGVILGHIALSQIKKSNGFEQGRGLALTGVIVGYVCLGFSLLVLALYIFLFFLPVFATSSVPGD